MLRCSFSLVVLESMRGQSQLNKDPEIKDAITSFFIGSGTASPFWTDNSPPPSIIPSNALLGFYLKPPPPSIHGGYIPRPCNGPHEERARLSNREDAIT